MAAPPSGPHAEDAGRHEGEAGETPTGAPGLRGGPGPGPAPGMAGIVKEEGVMPPMPEDAQRKGTVRLTGMTVIKHPPGEADETLKKKMPKGRRP